MNDFVEFSTGYAPHEITRAIDKLVYEVEFKNAIWDENGKYKTLELLDKIIAITARTDQSEARVDINDLVSDAVKTWATELVMSNPEKYVTELLESEF